MSMALKAVSVCSYPMSIPCAAIPCLFRVQFNDHGSQSCICVQLSHVYSVCSYSMSIPCAAIPCLFRVQLSHVYSVCSLMTMALKAASGCSYPMSIPCAPIPCLYRVQFNDHGSQSCIWVQLSHVYSVCRLMTWL